MNLFSLQWLVSDKISSVDYIDSSKSWAISFESGSSLYIECMWRLIEEGDICSTSEDHLHQFGLAKPFDGVAALNEISQYKIESVILKEGTGDLFINFEDLFILEIIVTSAGYEGWSATHPSLGTVFTQGGQFHASRNV